MSAQTQGRFRVGLDIGGTFTDLAVQDDAGGELLQVKSLSTVDPVECVMAGLGKAAEHFQLERREFLESVDRVFCFGSTHGLNTLLTGQGSKVGILTTKGHGDAYLIAQMARPGIHDMREAVEGTFAPLLPRSSVREVDERIDYTGSTVVSLAEDQVAAAVDELVEQEGIEALTIAFLWSHREPAHEQRAAEIARERHPELFVTIGSDITGALGEFTRLSTGVINAYIGRRVQTQANRLGEFLAGEGLNVPVLVMQMVGGVAPVEEIAKRPVALLKSGPVGGTVAAAAVTRTLETEDVVCIDMGGTSLDVSRITSGEMQLSRGFTILRHPITIPGVEIESIGAGGGSIAVLEEAGGYARLRVGPESAGSSPGPVSYGLGGENPTVTDANLLLGILNPEVPLGGEIELDAEAAAAVVKERISDRLGETPVESAWGIYQVVTAQMADATEHFMVSKGVDPRGYSLMAFGAATPQHALAIGARLGSPQVVIPAASPIFSAYGLMMTDIRHAYDVTDDSVSFPIEGAAVGVEGHQVDYVRARLEGAAQRPLEMLESEEVGLVSRELTLSIDLRYSGQELQLPIDLPAGFLEGGEVADLERAVAEWRAKYVQVYGEAAAWAEGSIEIVNYRAVAVGRLTSVGAGPDEASAASGNGLARFEVEPIGSRRVYLGAPYDADVYSHDAMRPGATVSGPAVIDGELTTVVLGPGDELTVDAIGNFVATPRSEAWNR